MSSGSANGKPIDLAVEKAKASARDRRAPECGIPPPTQALQGRGRRPSQSPSMPLITFGRGCWPTRCGQPFLTFTCLSNPRSYPTNRAAASVASRRSTLARPFKAGKNGKQSAQSRSDGGEYRQRRLSRRDATCALWASPPALKCRAIFPASRCDAFVG